MYDYWDLAAGRAQLNFSRPSDYLARINSENPYLELLICHAVSPHRNDSGTGRGNEIESLNRDFDLAAKS
jgi:hypothetical protein